MSLLNNIIPLLAFCFCVSIVVKADTPANCTYEDVKGTWIFSLGKGNNDRSLDCSKFTGPVVSKAKVHLLYPDIAIDEFGNKGFWTIIYNQGFEVVVAGRKYFAFSKYKGKQSFCHETNPGSSHDVLGHDWACYIGQKSEAVVKKSLAPETDSVLRFGHSINSDEMVASINKAQNSWTAVKYPQFEGLSHEDFVKMAGGKASHVANRPTAAPITQEDKRVMASLPEEFDWRNVNGVDYVSPVRNQGSCGSCYAFGSLAMNEARVRILTNNTQQPTFSTQDIVECSQYSQGCEGGFPYLIGGKYAEDYGLVSEGCNPYKGSDGSCKTDPSCQRHYSTKYRYIGGYYGGCNEAVMMKAIYEGGPVAAGFEVYNDFFQYHSGVYHHNFLSASSFGKFEPFELTNHAILVVGWGTSSGNKYWIVKNSWGESWGMSGYFWISRGNDECGIESMAMEASPVYMTTSK